MTHALADAYFFSRFFIIQNELNKLFRFATAQTHFYFDGKIFDQVDGLAMGSPLEPALTNLLMLLLLLIMLLLVIYLLLSLLLLLLVVLVIYLFVFYIIVICFFPLFL